MTRIAIIGAGSVVFTRNLTSDILLCPALQDSTIVLMDIDGERLELARALVQRMIDEREVPAQVVATTDLREALGGAKYVVCTVMVGGLDLYDIDISIPAKYGVGQCVGDTLGPGGVFRGLRTIPVLLDICREMDEVCAPDALLINYSNPMAINCWAVIEGSGRPIVGLCHSVQGTTRMLARWLGRGPEEMTVRVGGINHQAWFLGIEVDGEDVYPLLRKRIQDEDVFGEEPVRTDIMKNFGYFLTESSGHGSEYLPYFRKNEQMIVEELVPRFTTEKYFWIRNGRTGGNLDWQKERLSVYLDSVKAQIEGELPLPQERTDEYCSYILEAIETGRPTVIYGNVRNDGLITNLPQGCCVEVPCLVDRCGIRPCHIGDLPPQLAALNRTNINVQELAVKGYLAGDRELIRQAVQMDPLSAAVCTLTQIRNMVDEMFVAQAEWLPQFD